MRKIKDAIDYLEEAEGQGRDVGDYLSRMLDLERKVSAKRAVSNANIAETPKEAAGETPRLRGKSKNLRPVTDSILCFTTMKGPLRKRNTKAYKEWQKEFDELEKEVARKTRIGNLCMKSLVQILVSGSLRYRVTALSNLGSRVVKL